MYLSHQGEESASKAHRMSPSLAGSIENREGADTDVASASRVLVFEVKLLDFTFL